MWTHKSIHTCQHNWWRSFTLWMSCMAHTLKSFPLSSIGSFLNGRLAGDLYWEKELCCSVLRSINFGSELELIYIMVAWASYRKQNNAWSGIHKADSVKQIVMFHIWGRSYVLYNVQVPSMMLNGLSFHDACMSTCWPWRVVYPFKTNTINNWSIHLSEIHPE